MLNALLGSVAGCISSVDNGDGSYRLDFESLPSRLATDAEVLSAKKISSVAANRAEARRRIEAKYPLWRQQSAVLGVYPESYTLQMASDIAAVVAAENAAADAIEAATTEAEVAAVTVNWPVI